MTEAAQAGNRLNVFISYSRDDLGFSDQLSAALGLTGFETTLDRQGISGGEDWKSRLGNLIRAADTVAFVLSPSSARSETCAWEVEEATRLGKRIIPVLCRPLEDSAVPSRLADLNYIFFYAEPKSPGSGFGLGLVRLVAALNTDLAWLREHTRYLERASEWDTGRRPANRLLYGDDIALAKAWATARPKDAPEPTALHLDFIRESETEQTRQQSAEAQRLAQLGQAQAEREAAFAERAAAQEREAEARTREALSQQREALQAKKAVQRTRIGLAVAVALALTAGWLGLDAREQGNKAQVALAKLRAENIKRTTQAFETGWNALAGLKVQSDDETYNTCGSIKDMKGVRQIYCEISHVLNLQTLSALARLPVFVGGPHVLATKAGVQDEQPQYNLRSHQIGRYNPAFVEWLGQFAVPALDNPQFRDSTRALFKDHVQATALNYYQAYIALFNSAQSEQRRRITASFESDLNKYTATMEKARRTGSGMDGAWTNGPSYKLQAALGTITGSAQRDDTPGADYDTAVAMSFWVRRNLDGTHRQFFDILVNALTAYGALPAGGPPKNLDDR